MDHHHFGTLEGVGTHPVVILLLQMVSAATTAQFLTSSVFLHQWVPIGACREAPNPLIWAPRICPSTIFGTFEGVGTNPVVILLLQMVSAAPTAQFLTSSVFLDQWVPIGAFREAPNPLI